MGINEYESSPLAIDHFIYVLGIFKTRNIIFHMEVMEIINSF
jgi:hypothetical protein